VANQRADRVLAGAFAFIITASASSINDPINWQDRYALLCEPHHCRDHATRSIKANMNSVFAGLIHRFFPPQK
jgi:hypothetical protein